VPWTSFAMRSAGVTATQGTLSRGALRLPERAGHLQAQVDRESAG